MEMVSVYIPKKEVGDRVAVKFEDGYYIGSLIKVSRKSDKVKVEFDDEDVKIVPSKEVILLKLPPLPNKEEAKLAKEREKSLIFRPMNREWVKKNRAPTAPYTKGLKGEKREKLRDIAVLLSKGFSIPRLFDSFPILGTPSKPTPLFVDMLHIARYEFDWSPVISADKQYQKFWEKAEKPFK